MDWQGFRTPGIHIDHADTQLVISGNVFTDRIFGCPLCREKLNTLHRLDEIRRRWVGRVPHIKNHPIRGGVGVGAEKTVNCTEFGNTWEE